jgi:winged helix DNA-binding protein
MSGARNIRDSSRICYQRLSNQRLTGVPFEKTEDVVRWLTAVQSQDYAGAKWAIGQRLKETSDDNIDELFNEGKILRTHVMRPTWHFVMPEDIRWMLKLTAPRVHAVSAYYFRKMELDQTVFTRSNTVISKALRGGKHLTRDELGQVLGRAKIDAKGLRLIYLMMRAELDAIICSGPLRGKQFTYALLEERVPECKTLKRDGALAKLTIRYFTGHGPALLRDFVWWSGLTIADAKAGLEMARPELNHDVIDGKSYWFGASGPVNKTKSPIAHLLPNYDEYLIAYKDRDASFDPALKKRIGERDNALAAHIVVLNGQVIGGWRRTIKKHEVEIHANLLIDLNKAEHLALKQTAERYGAFLKKSATRLYITS